MALALRLGQTETFKKNKTPFLKPDLRVCHRPISQTSQTLSQLAVTMTPPPPAPTFRDCVRAVSQCTSKDYERVVLAKTLPPLARLLSPVLLKIDPGFFFNDIEIIRELARCSSLRELDMEYVRQRGYIRGREGFLRRRLRLRVSRDRVLALAEKVFASNPSPPAPSAPPS
jgi:hypothetical protein